MYCPKCGKQVPDNATFCSECGVKLKEDTTPEEQKNNKIAISDWFLCVGIVAICVCVGFSNVNPNDYLGYYPLGLQGELQEFAQGMVWMSGFIGVIGLVVGISGLHNRRLKNSNPPDLTEQRELKAAPPTAQKLTMQGHASVIKCSHCGKAQTSNRTTCQSCGAKFVES